MTWRDPKDPTLPPRRRFAARPSRTSRWYQIIDADTGEDCGALEGGVVIVPGSDEVAMPLYQALEWLGENMPPRDQEHEE